MRLIAAAVQPNPSIGHLLESYRPFGRHIEHRTCLHLKPGRSSGATAPAVMRQALVSVLHSEVGGLLIAAGSRRGPADFASVRAAASGEPLRHTEPDAIILPARQHGQAPATTATEVAAGEPVILAYTCTDLYMTAMGRAVFGGQIARRLLGLADVTSVLRYDTDNAALRALIEQLPHIVLPRIDSQQPHKPAVRSRRKETEQPDMREPSGEGRDLPVAHIGGYRMRRGGRPLPWRMKEPSARR